MSLPYLISRRYTQSKKQSKFISLVSTIAIIGIALGVTVLILTLTVLEAFEKSVEEKIINFNSHITITAFGNRNLPSHKEVIPKLEKLLNPYSKSISPFVSKNVIINSKQRSDGIIIKGINKDLDNSKIEEYIIEGKFSIRTKDNMNGIIIGRKLAKKLSIILGDKVTVFSLRNDQIPSYSNPPSIDQFIVTGIYESGMSQYDDVYAYTDINAARELFGIGDKVSGYNIQLNNISKIDSLSNLLQENLRYPYYVRTIFKIHQNVFTWLELQKEPIPIVLGLIIIVAVFNIIGMLLMIVLEKTSDIGILKSLGSSRKLISKIFVLQGMYLAVIGILIGNGLAFIISMIQKYFNIISLPSEIYFISNVPIIFSWQNYLIVSAIAFILSILASFIPSWIASKVRPLSAIRFE